MTDTLNSKPFGNTNRPIKEVEPIIEETEFVEEDLKVEETKEEEGQPVDTSLLLYQLEDGSLGMQVIGDVGLKEVTLFQKYLEKYTESMWNNITNFHDEERKDA